jgi:hypothetical protein
MEDFDEAEE